MTRRAVSRHQRELRRQRLVMTITGAAIGVALLAVLGGFLYERLWIPSRPIARAGDATLSRGDYWAERRNEIARRLSQSIQLLSMFGGQFGDQFEGQIASLDAELPNIRTADVDDETVAGWIQRQVIVQSAASEYGVQASDGEIAQRLVEDLGRAFPAPQPPPTSTTTLTPTAVLSETAGVTATTAPEAGATAAATGEAATAAATGEAATPAATNTPAPSPTPEPTLLPEAAQTETEAILGRLYDAYQAEMLRLNPEQSAGLTIDDFRTALHDQYLQQVVTSKVQEQLVPEAGFQASTEPTGYEVSHILVGVTTTVSDTQEQQDAAYAAARPQAEAILQELRGGADFAALATERSDDYATRSEGGKLTEFDKTGKTTSDTQIDPAIVQAALALQVGQISDLIRTPFGWHIVKLDRLNVPSSDEQLQDARTKKFDEWVAQKRAAMTIDRFPAVTPTPTSEPTGTPAALPTAQLASTPTPTAVVTSTATLSGTATLPVDTTPTATSTAPPAPTAPALPTSAASPSAVLPTPTSQP
jgi:hypothetical protein